MVEHGTETDAGILESGADDRRGTIPREISFDIIPDDRMNMSVGDFHDCFA
jgi:hypothetical protein